MLALNGRLIIETMNIITECIIYFAGIIVINILYIHKLNTLKTQLQFRDNQLERCGKVIDILDNQNRFLKLKLDMYKDRYYNNNPDFNNDIQDAVKYAMKSAHPDNGGKSEDFQRFRKLYESMK